MESIKRHMEAMEKINALLNVRERSCKEARERLLKAGFSEDETEEAVEAAVRCGLLDEARYTKAFVRGKAHLGWGRKKIERQLKTEGISQDLIEECVNSSFEDGDELERAIRVLQRKPSHSKDPYSAYMRRLIGKGYSYDIAKQAVSQIMSNTYE